MGKATSKAPAKAPKKKEGGGGGKAKKKKWSKGKTRDKLNNLVLFDKATYDKLYKEVPTYKIITPAIVSERLKVRGSLARRLSLNFATRVLSSRWSSTAGWQSTPGRQPLMTRRTNRLFHPPSSCHLYAVDFLLRLRK